MSWTVTMDGDTLREDDLTVEQSEKLFVLANQGVPHAEIDVHPLHCPSCRIACAALALEMSGMDLDAAIVRIAAMRRTDLLDVISIEGGAEVEPTG